MSYLSLHCSCWGLWSYLGVTQILALAPQNHPSPLLCPKCAPCSQGCSQDFSRGHTVSNRSYSPDNHVDLPTEFYSIWQKRLVFKGGWGAWGATGTPGPPSPLLLPWCISVPLCYAARSCYTCCWMPEYLPLFREKKYFLSSLSLANAKTDWRSKCFHAQILWILIAVIKINFFLFSWWHMT